MSVRMRCLRFASLLLAVAAAGCSEKPAGDLVWKQDLLGIKTALNAVVALSPSEAMAVGQALPEFALQARPLSLRFSGGGWTEIPVPQIRSTALLGAAADPSGSVWAVGRSVSSEAEPFDAIPVVYRFSGGSWATQALDELGPQDGVTLTGVATSGTGPDLEVRAVGDSVLEEGRIFRFASGHWSVMPAPAPATRWTLRSIAYSRATGTWYAVGRDEGQGGGVILMDRGAGWESVAGPAVEWSAVACDGRGIPHLAGNRPAGGSTQGVVYRMRLGRWTEVPIARRTSGGFHILALGFDAEGNGWAVGGRDPSGPFFAGTSPKGWVEFAVEAELEEHPETEEVAEGDMTGVAVHGRTVAFAVGSAQEADPEGGSEFQPRVFRLVFRPAGETDLPTAPH
jgi:hypothetical protein